MDALRDSTAEGAVDMIGPLSLLAAGRARGWNKDLQNSGRGRSLNHLALPQARSLKRASIMRKSSHENYFARASDRLCCVLAWGIGRKGLAGKPAGFARDGTIPLRFDVDRLLVHVRERLFLHLREGDVVGRVVGIVVGERPRTCSAS